MSNVVPLPVRRPAADAGPAGTAATRAADAAAAGSARDGGAAGVPTARAAGPTAAPTTAPTAARGTIGAPPPGCAVRPRREPAGAAREMLQRLPGGMLAATAARFPHVLDALAAGWPDPATFHATLDRLVYDERGGRAGFPVEVLAELAELRDCYERWVGPRSRVGR